MAINSSEGSASFIHFQGVVEDRHDPLHIGRVRVRCFGIHTEDKSLIPTDQLPWAQPVMPFTSASISGVGTSPTGPVEGSWVFGLFLDGSEMQQPIILGTLVGIPKEKISSTQGFSDPLGNYPKTNYMKQPDTNRLARGEAAWSEESLHNKEAERTLNVPVAVPPTVKTVRDLEGPIPALPEDLSEYPEPFASGNKSVLSADDPATRKPFTGSPSDRKDFYYRYHWNEPYPRTGGHTGDASPKAGDLDCVDKTQPWQMRKAGINPSRSLYPYNHVYRSESGHVMEYDDTPGGERIHQYHKKGTFYEIQPDGTKVTKVVGDNYQVYLKGNHVVVEGHMNLTVKGDVRLFVEKNMYQEVKGDYHLRVDGDMVTKIRGNEQKVVMTDKATQINGNERKRVSKDNQKQIGGNNKEFITGKSDTDISSNVSVTIKGWKRETIGGSLTLYTAGNTNITVGSSADAAKGKPISVGGITQDGKKDGLSAAQLKELDPPNGPHNVSNFNRIAANTGRLTIKTTSNVNIQTSANFNLDTAAEMDLNIGTNYDLTTGGTYKKKITGAAHETYQSTYFVKYVGQNEFDHAGIWKEMKGANYYSRHAAGVDYACSSDPSRTTGNDCSALATPAAPSH